MCFFQPLNIFKLNIPATRLGLTCDLLLQRAVPQTSCSFPVRVNKVKAESLQARVQLKH